MSMYPLHNVRVLDLCPMFAGNFATQILSDLGAEVIKIESTQHWQFGPRGQTARPTKQMTQSAGGKWGYFQKLPGKRPWERYAGFHTHSRNKLSVTVDLRRPEGVSIFKSLVKVADIFVDSNNAATVEKLGIDYPVLEAVNPSIIMVRMPGYGLSGPYRGNSAMAQTLEAFCGHTMIRGYRGMPPTGASSSVSSDAAAGAGGALAAIMALHFRRRTGLGQLVEMAQVENFMPLLGPAFMDFIFNGRIQEPMGNRHSSSAPCECYPCAGEDQWVAITVHNDAEWLGLRRALGDPEWAQDPGFGTVIERHRRQDEIDGHLASWTKTREKYDVMALLQTEGVPCGPVIEDGQALDDPHLQARRHFQEITHPETGPYLLPGIPWRMSEIELRVRSPAPLLGQHNGYVYKELLGYSDAECARLEAEGHIGTEPAPHIP